MKKQVSSSLLCGYHDDNTLYSKKSIIYFLVNNAFLAIFINGVNLGWQKRSATLEIHLLFEYITEVHGDGTKLPL